MDAPVRGSALVLEGRSHFEEFPFHAEESAQHPGEEIFSEGRTEVAGNLV
jgi:hypothetical protein